MAESEVAQKLLSFTHLIGALKDVERFKSQVFWRDYPQPARYESVADHSWRMAMMLAILEPHLSQPIDMRKALVMALIHDLPEMIAGDASPLGTDGTGKDSHAYNKEIAAARFENEKAAAEKIFGELPEAQGKEFLSLWLEYEEQSSYEARVVKALDKMEAKIQAFEYQGGDIYKEHLEWDLTYGVQTFAADPAIQALGDLVLDKFRTNFKEFVSQK